MQPIINALKSSTVMQDRNEHLIRAALSQNVNISHADYAEQTLARAWKKRNKPTRLNPIFCTYGTTGIKTFSAICTLSQDVRTRHKFKANRSTTKLGRKYETITAATTTIWNPHTHTLVSSAHLLTRVKKTNNWTQKNNNNKKTHGSQALPLHSAYCIKCIK